MKFLCLFALCSASFCTWQGLADPARFLVFSKTTMFRHASITNGIAALRDLAARNDFSIEATEDSSAFTSENLARYRAIVFLNTSGDILDETQQTALQQYLTQGGGLAGIHAAIAGGVATEGSWSWFGQLCCASFTNHSEVVQATLRVEDRGHPSTAHLPAAWVRTDEWYNFISSPRPAAQVLISIDESTYSGGSMGADHPVAWCRPIGKGRFWYTALGHTESAYSEPLFRQHLLGGLQYAAGLKAAEQR